MAFSSPLFMKSSKCKLYQRVCQTFFLYICFRVEKDPKRSKSTIYKHNDRTTNYREVIRFFVCFFMYVLNPLKARRQKEIFYSLSNTSIIRRMI